MRLNPSVPGTHIIIFARPRPDDDDDDDDESPHIALIGDYDRDDVITGGN